MRVWLLGTAGWMPTDSRETTCLATRFDETLFLFDAGTGIRRLASASLAHLTEGATDIHLFLTHYHLDHTCGLAYLSGVLPGRRLTIHAPSAELTGVEPRETLAGLIRRPFNPRNLTDLTHVSVRPLAHDEVVAGHLVSTRAQKHSDVSVAYRVDDAFVIATDTVADPATATFATGVQVLFHEAWYCASELTVARAPDAAAGYASHSEAESVAKLAACAGVRSLVLIHLNPLLDEGALESMAAAARVHCPATLLPLDCASVETGSGHESL